MANKNKQPNISDEEMKMPDQSFGVHPEPEKQGSVLVLVLGVLIVLLVLILAGLYLWGTTLKNELPTLSPAATRPTAEENNEPEVNNADADVQTLQTVSTSDELAAIEADVESTNLDSLDAELNDIEAELDAGLTE